MLSRSDRRQSQVLPGWARIGTGSRVLQALDLRRRQRAPLAAIACPAALASPASGDWRVGIRPPHRTESRTLAWRRPCAQAGDLGSHAINEANDQVVQEHLSREVITSDNSPMLERPRTYGRRVTRFQRVCLPPEPSALAFFPERAVELAIDGTGYRRRARQVTEGKRWLCPCLVLGRAGRTA